MLRFRASTTRALLAATTIVLPFWLSMTSAAWARAEFALRPGHLYGNGDLGLFEFDAALNPVAFLPLPHTRWTQGVAFTPDAHLVTSAFEINADSTQTHHVLELDSAGHVVHDVDLHISSLDRAADIDVDAAGRIYAASTPNLIEVQPDFGGFRTMPWSFNRASGVAVGSDDFLYATDQGTRQVIVFDPARNHQRNIGTGGLPTGIDFGPAGQLYVCDYTASQLRRLDLASNTFSTVLTNHDFISDVEFAADGSYYLSWYNGHRIEHRSPQDALLQFYESGDTSDALAVYVPEPGAAAVGLLLAVLGTTIGARHRRRS